MKNDKKIDMTPVIRLHKAVLDNFKSVQHGVIEFECSKKHIPCGTESDILGIYGQNGSGKTAFIEALSVLKWAMCGDSVPDIYGDCISVKTGEAKLSFTFDLQYPEGTDIKATYSFCLTTVQKSPEERKKYVDFLITYNDNTSSQYENKVKIYNETLSFSGIAYGKNVNVRTLINTGSGNPFGPAAKLKEFVGNNRDLLLDVQVVRKLAAEKSESLIFADDMIPLYDKSGWDPLYKMIIFDLQNYAINCLHIIDTKYTGLIRLNAAIPMYGIRGVLPIKTNAPNIAASEDFKFLESYFSNVNIVLQQLIPGMSLCVRKISDTVLENGKSGVTYEMMSERDGDKMPLRYESDGVRKIISELELIIAAFCEESFTVAIDEFDAGIFEYLLGEILQIFEMSGRGQFIFTSHNLRPLEVISNKFLYFTTTNPENRYVHLKRVKEINNLRDTYYREIIMEEQDEELYNQTQSYRIINALNQLKFARNEDDR